MNINNFLKKNWVYVYSRRMTYQKTRLYYRGFANGLFGYKLKAEIYRYKNGNMFNYHDKKEEEKFSKYLLKNFLNKKFAIKNLSNLEEEIKGDFDDYLLFVKSIPENTAKLSDKELCAILDKYYQKEDVVDTKFWVLFGNVEVVLIEATRQLLLKEGLSESNAKDILSKLSEPIKIIPIDLERLSLLKVALGRGDLMDHYKEFCYIPMYDIDYEPYPLKYFQDRLNVVDPKGISGEIKNIEEKYAKRYTIYSEIIDRFKDKKHIYYLLKFFGAYGYLKDFKPYTRDKGSFHIRRIFEEVAKRFDITLTEALFLNEKEIPDLITKKISIPNLRQRINNSAYFCSNKKIYLVTDKKALKKIDRILNKKEGLKELKGIGVSKGFAKGIVSIILSSNDFPKFKKGEILVTSATRPDFIPIIKKAAAIVADEGGILSHAAIISRELGKPCVVGTIKGTQVLKDGDMVEVDANKGIIKIIK